MALEENKLYTYIEVLEELQKNRSSEIRMFINYPNHKKLRGLMFDDGDRFYSTTPTEHSFKRKGMYVTKSIMNKGHVSFKIKIKTEDEDESLTDAFESFKKDLENEDEDS